MEIVKYNWYKLDHYYYIDTLNKCFDIGEFPLYYIYNQKLELYVPSFIKSGATFEDFIENDYLLLIEYNRLGLNDYSNIKEFLKHLTIHIKSCDGVNGSFKTQSIPVKHLTYLDDIGNFKKVYEFEKIIK